MGSFSCFRHQNFFLPVFTLPGWEVFLVFGIIISSCQFFRCRNGKFFLFPALKFLLASFYVAEMGSFSCFRHYYFFLPVFTLPRWEVFLVSGIIISSFQFLRCRDGKFFLFPALKFLLASFYVAEMESFSCFRHYYFFLPVFTLPRWEVSLVSGIIISSCQFLRCRDGKFLPFSEKSFSVQLGTDPSSNKPRSLYEKREMLSHLSFFVNTCVKGFEPSTFWSVARRSIQLSYTHLYFIAPATKLYYHKHHSTSRTIFRFARDLSFWDNNYP